MPDMRDSDAIGPTTRSPHLRTKVLACITIGSYYTNEKLGILSQSVLVEDAKVADVSAN
jgi:hypothetical protein